jgi:large subunit ribosomal protein L28
MSKVCQITGKRTIVGNNVSHSNRKTRRTFNVNLHTKRFFLPEENRFITLKVSTSGMRTINKIGISEAVKRGVEAGLIRLK